jgi:hypothetical protein
MAAAAAIVSGLIKDEGVAATLLLAGPALVEVEESEDEKESPSYRILYPLVPELELLALQREFTSSSFSPAPVPTLLGASLFMFQCATTRIVAPKVLAGWSKRPMPKPMHSNPNNAHNFTLSGVLESRYAIHHYAEQNDRTITCTRCSSDYLR